MVSLSAKSLPWECRSLVKGCSGKVWKCWWMWRPEGLLWTMCSLWIHQRSEEKEPLQCEDRRICSFHTHLILQRCRFACDIHTWWRTQVTQPLAELSGSVYVSVISLTGCPTWTWNIQLAVPDLKASCSKSRNCTYPKAEKFSVFLTALCSFAHTLNCVVALARSSFLSRKSHWPDPGSAIPGWDVLARKHSLLMAVPHLWMDTGHCFLPLLIGPFDVHEFCVMKELTGDFSFA